MTKAVSNGVARDERAALDEAAIARIFEELRPKLESFARQRGLSLAGEDVVQETFIAALTEFRAGKFQGRSSIQTWVYGILRHKVGDQRRADMRESRSLVSLPDYPADSTTLPESNSSTTRPPNPELVVLVHEVLNALPARHWLVLMLNKRVGLKTREIAPLLRLSPGRTGAILAEAQEMFRRGISAIEEKPSGGRLINKR